MRANELWELFKDTGDPMCWLLLRGTERMASDGGARQREEHGRSEDYDRRDTA